MALIPTWPIAAACLAAGALLGAGADHLWMDGKVDSLTATLTEERGQHKEELRVREVQRATDERAARTREQTLAARAGQIEQEKVNAITDINRRHADAIARLQNRPDRKPASTGGLPGAAPACQGATGAGLSRPDAGFLVGEAARARTLQAELAKCYAAYDSLSGSSIRVPQ